MARGNLKLNIKIPSNQKVSNKYTFTESNEDGLRIPYRYPFVDIANYTELKNIGYFRHKTKDVDPSLGSNETNTEGKLGFELPKTEKLILLAKKGAETAESLIIRGSKKYDIPDLTVTLPAGAIGDIYEIDLYDFGLYISDPTLAELGIVIDNITATVTLALIARMG